MAARTKDHTAHSTRGTWAFLDHPPHGLVAALIAVHIAIALYALTHAPATEAQGDIQRFSEITTRAGTPYRDFQVEYAPLELAAIDLIATPSVSETHRRVVVLALLLDILAWAILARAWDRRVGIRYLLLAIPMQPLMFVRLDLLPVSLAVLSCALVRDGRQRSGGVALATAAFTKVWPVFLAPTLFLTGRRRAATWLIATLVAGSVGWLAVGGVEGVRQVGTFRGATGWHSESVVGTIVWITTGDPLRMEAGTDRVGAVPGWALPALALGLVLLLVAVWKRARRWQGSPQGVPSLVAITAVIVLSPLLSLQYLIWLLPWAAIAWAENGPSKRFTSLASIATLITGALANLYLWAPYAWLVPVVAGVLVARNGLLVWLVVSWFLPWHTDTARGNSRPADLLGREWRQVSARPRRG